MRFVKLGIVVVVLLALAGAYEAGLFARLADPETLVADVVGLGAYGYVAFIIAYTLLQPFGVPGTIFVVAAPLIWPWPTAFALSMIGTMGASVVGFAFARFIARAWISARIPARFRNYSDALERNAFQTVVILRLIFWMPQVLHFFFGVSKVKFWTHFWGSLVGYAPPLLAVSYFGSEMFDASGSLQPGAWRIFAGMIVGSLLVILISRVYNRRATASSRCHSRSIRESTSHPARSHDR